MKQQVAKRISDTYLYSIGDYEKNLYTYFVHSTVMDKESEDMQNIKFDVKKATPHVSLLKVFDSDNVVFLNNATPLPRALKVFAAQDIKSGDKRLKIFVDMSDILTKDAGKLIIRPKDLDKFISYLASALSYLIYYAEPGRLTNNGSLIKTGTECFAKLFTYIIDNLRIGGVDKVREKCLYLASIYYQVNILRKDFADSTETRAKAISKLSTREIEMIEIQLDADTFKDIFNFVNSVAKVIKAENFKLDNFIERWIFLFGPGTQFATELYPAFSTFLTNAYCGAYLNNQKTIEKIIGRDMVEYSTYLFDVGSDIV